MGSASASSCATFFRFFARRPECMPLMPPPGMSAPRTRSACRRQFWDRSENFPVRRCEQDRVPERDMYNMLRQYTFLQGSKRLILKRRRQQFWVISHISIQIVMINTYLLGHDPRILGRKKLKKVSWLRQLTSYKICQETGHECDLPAFLGLRSECT